jgi:hypothetical protein
MARRVMSRITDSVKESAFCDVLGRFIAVNDTRCRRSHADG